MELALLSKSKSIQLYSNMYNIYIGIHIHGNFTSDLSPGFSMSPRLPRRLEPFTSWLAVAAAAATAASTASALGVGSWQQRGVVMAAMAQ